MHPFALSRVDDPAKAIAAHAEDPHLALIAGGTDLIGLMAFATLDADVIVLRRTGEKSIPFTDLHRLPGSTPERDNVLERGELIVAIDVPARIEGRASHYLKLRDRQSYEFALVSAAAAVAADGRRIRSVRLGLSGVAHKPRRLAASGTATKSRRMTIIASKMM